MVDGLRPEFVLTRLMGLFRLSFARGKFNGFVQLDFYFKEFG